jgi:hypothetical protein
MKEYCFNYSIEGVATIIPMFAKGYGESPRDAFFELEKRLKACNTRGVKVHMTNYPIDRCAPERGGVAVVCMNRVEEDIRALERMSPMERWFKGNQ